MSQKSDGLNTKKELESTFNFYDKDKSGFIDSNELFDAMRKYKKNITKQQVDIIIEKVDTDKSGKISFDGLFFFIK